MSRDVVDTTYYDLLNVSPHVSPLELKKAYRRAALQHHPDKNPDDDSAHQRFQDIGLAYQVLSNAESRRKYDECGLQAAETVDEFDADTLFNRIFGGSAFREWIGDLAYLSRAMELVELKKRKKKRSTDAAGHESQLTPYTHRRSKFYESRKTSDTLRPELKDEALAYGYFFDEFVAANRRHKHVYQRRIEDVCFCILSKIEPMAQDPDSVSNYQHLQKLASDEANMMKLESFGDKLLHTIGEAFLVRSNAVLNAWWGSGMVSYFGDKWQVFQDSYAIANSGLQAKRTIKKIETDHATASPEDTRQDSASPGRSPKITPEKLSWQDERLLTGKILATCWETTVKEVHDVLREVCNRLLYDQSLPQIHLVGRAEALVAVGEVFSRVSREPGDELSEEIFELIVADAMKK